MSSILRIALEGAFTNFKRIFFASDRVTDMELRKQISTLSVEVDERVDKESYETYELTGDGVITVTGYVGDDADSNPFVYPMTFKRK